ncbi:hypothetical protein BDV98DRAFT_433484 [Pterulicium gracile]|uniref:Uncharacterized protein n=1 Tax=Pterulicium gracile TaxID=1884261 RepID=A0A5C3QKW3_9AGAR|nr:hypothetical protein BDV98DRAFT_433484 [Pterula gracilis]
MQPSTSPISVLCDELLSTIFLIDFYNSKEAPWNLAVVCKTWRRICLLTPEIWTRFNVGRDHDLECKVVDKTCVDSQLQISRCCLKLQRSQARPIQVDIEGPSPSCSISMMRALVQHTLRWESFQSRRPYESVNTTQQ